MNAKTAKYIRDLIKFDPKEERTYTTLESEDRFGRPLKIETTKVSTGKRRDYQLLKKYFKGQDVILPNHLRGLVE